MPSTGPLKYALNSPQHRRFILSTYLRILRAIRTHFPQDRLHAQQHASELFHQNMNESDPQKVTLHVEEAEARYEMALHYKIWEPRPFLFPREGQDLASDATLSHPHMIPKYLASEYRAHFDEAQVEAQRRAEEGSAHYVDFDDDDERKW